MELPLSVTLVTVPKGNLGFVWFSPIIHEYKAALSLWRTCSRPKDILASWWNTISLQALQFNVWIFAKQTEVIQVCVCVAIATDVYF